MLELNNTQGHILGVFSEHYADNFGNIQGISGGMLERMNIPAKSFRNHKDYLIDNYLIRLSKIEYHATRNWFYYQITPFGVLAYMKWSNTKKQTILFDGNLFPLIGKHWKKLSKKFGNSLDLLLIDSIDRFSLVPVGSLIKSDQIAYTLSLIESVQLVSLYVDYTFHRFYDAPDVLQLEPKMDLNTFDEFDNNENLKSDSMLIDRFSFLFFYNLSNLQFNANQKSSLYMKLYSDKMMSKIRNKKLDVVKSDMHKFIEKTNKDSQFVIKLINKDNELSKLFHETFKELSKKIDKKIISNIQNQLV